MEKSEAAVYAEIFKALGDETRLKIVQMLNTRPRAVGEIVDFFSLSQPTISRHLNVLKQCSLVTSKRKGQQVFYSLDEDIFRQKLLKFFESLESAKGGVSAAKKKS